MQREIELTFKKLIKQIPKDQRKKKFVFICYGLAAYDKFEYKGYKVFNIESERDEITIMSKDDFDKALAWNDDLSTHTETDDEFLQDVRKMIAQGTLAKKIAQKIKKEIETLLEPLAVLAVLRKHIRSTNTEAQIKQATIKREIILSGYQIKE